MLLKTTVLTLFIHFAACQFFPCPTVVPLGVVTSIKLNSCLSKDITCGLSNTTHVQFEYTFISSVPAESLKMNLTIRQNGKTILPYLEENDVCKSVKCPVKPGTVSKWYGISGVTKIDTGLIAVKALMTDEQDRVIFCVINPVLILPKLSKLFIL